MKTKSDKKGLFLCIVDFAELVVYVAFAACICVERGLKDESFFVANYSITSSSRASRLQLYKNSEIIGELKRKCMCVIK